MNLCFMILKYDRNVCEVADGSFEQILVGIGFWRMPDIPLQVDSNYICKCLTINMYNEQYTFHSPQPQYSVLLE